MPDQPAPPPPVTPPPGQTSVDAADWVRWFVPEALADERLPLDEGAMLSWFTSAIEAGITYGRADATGTPTVYAENEPATHPANGQVVAVLRRYSDRAPASWGCLARGPHYDPVEDGDRWLPLPPTTGGEQ